MYARIIASLSLLFLLSSFALASAEEKPARQQAQFVELTVSPAVEPAPALKHRLLPPYLDRRDDNAAPLYFRALLVLEGVEPPENRDGKLWENISQWLTTDPDKLPRDEVQQVLDRYAGVLDEARMAARRERCDWALGVRERENIFATLLPEVQTMRNLARLVALEARLRIAAGRFDEALASLQIGYALARHLSQQPFLISGLVAAAIAQQMHDQLETLIAAEDSPNLYWAIAALPEPLVDLRPSLEVEGHSIFLMFPKLRDVRQRELTPDQWRQEFRDAVRTAGNLINLLETEKEQGFGPLTKELARAAAIEALLELRYPAARKQLAAWGYDAKRLDAMPKGQAVLVHEVEYFERERDNMFKWFALPYWQAYDPLQKANAAFSARAAKPEKFSPSPLADLVLPALSKVYDTQARVERRSAALLAVESLRMHAAAHAGRWPARLEDAAAAAPIPINPYNGQLPDYAVGEQGATLTFDGRGTEPDLVYRLRIKTPE